MKISMNFIFSNLWIGFMSVLTLGVYPNVIANIRQMKDGLSQHKEREVSDVQNMVNDMRSCIKAYHEK